MVSFRILSTLLSFTVLANALPSPSPYLPYRPYTPPTVSRRHTASKQAIAAINSISQPAFLISDIITESIPNSPNNTIYFEFTDPNSNTSTLCSCFWTSSNTISTRPMGPSYLPCAQTNGTAKPEYFEWYFASYTNNGNFSLELVHEFSDPAQYPPPYDYVEYFASAAVVLDCDVASGEVCTLPSGTNPIKATITALSN